jgi:hypothetical protein
MGFVSAIVEMLVQSHISGSLFLIPALSSNIAMYGSIIGIKARGDVIVSMVWRHGKISSAILTVNSYHPWHAPKGNVQKTSSSSSIGSGLVEDSTGYYSWPNGWENNNIYSSILIVTPNPIQFLSSSKLQPIITMRKGKKSKKTIKGKIEACAEASGDEMPSYPSTSNKKSTSNGFRLIVTKFPCQILLCSSSLNEELCRGDLAKIHELPEVSKF